MNFINGYRNFDVRTAKVNEKEKEEKGKEVAEETKPAEKPAEASETVVLTGSAQDILAIYGKGTVKGANSTRGISSIQGGEDGLEDAMNEYTFEKNRYLANVEEMSVEEKIQALNDLSSSIDDIVELFGDAINSELAVILIADKSRWSRELNSIAEEPVNGQVGSVQLFFENMYNIIDSDFAFNHLTGLERIQYFRGLVKDLQRNHNFLLRFIDKNGTDPYLEDLSSWLYLQIEKANNYLSLRGSLRPRQSTPA